MDIKSLISSAFILLTSHALSNPCPDSLNWNQLTNMCETSPLAEPMDFAALNKTAMGKKEIQTKCDQMATRYGVKHRMWLTPSGDKCAFCVAGTTYDPVSQICM